MGQLGFVARCDEIQRTFRSRYKAQLFREITNPCYLGYDPFDIVNLFPKDSRTRWVKLLPDSLVIRKYSASLGHEFVRRIATSDRAGTLQKCGRWAAASFTGQHTADLKF